MRSVNIISFIIIILLSFTTNSLANLTDGLKAYYSFNVNADDESGNGNHGIVNGALLIDDRFGNLESAYSFDGINDYINIGTGVKPSFPVTVSSWVKLNSFHDGCVFKNDYQNQSSSRYGLRISYREEGKIVGYVFNGSSSSTHRKGKISIDKVVTIGNWHHFAVIFHNYNNIQLYWDGKECAGNYQGDGKGMSYSSGSGAIGRIKEDPIPRPVDGYLDDIRVYSSALSDIQILQHYYEGLYCAIDTANISASTGGTVNIFLDAGNENSNRMYLLLGSISGTNPGTPLPGGLVNLPLNWDVFTELVLSMTNTTVFSNFLSILDTIGMSTARVISPVLPSSSSGVKLYFAYCISNPFDFASNPVEIEIVP